MKSPIQFGILAIVMGAISACDPDPAEPAAEQSHLEDAQEHALEQRGLATDEEERTETQETDVSERGVADIHTRAVRDIAQARCERAQRRGEIGPNEDYSSEQACLSQMKKAWGDELSKGASKKNYRNA